MNLIIPPLTTENPGYKFHFTQKNYQFFFKFEKCHWKMNRGKLYSLL